MQERDKRATTVIFESTTSFEGSSRMLNLREREQVRDALDFLTDEQVGLMSLRFGTPAEEGEIAAAKKIPVDAVKAQYNAALRMLRSGPRGRPN